MNANPNRLDLTALEKSLTSLTQLYERVTDEAFMARQDNVVRLGLQAGLIQNLEFTYFDNVRLNICSMAK
jgi:hypothetical protein